jgi:hypothetical protein
MSTLVFVLFVLAVVAGGVGLFAEALRWMLLVALVLLVAGILSGLVNRANARA